MFAEEESAAELRRRLREAEERERAEADSLRLLHPPRHRYFVRPTARLYHDRIFDPTCRYVDIGRECLNRDEAKEFGHSDWECNDGSMSWVFNEGTGCLICPVGGGSQYIYIGTGASDERRRAWADAMVQISRLIAQQMGEGWDVDITDIAKEFFAKTEG